MPAKSKRQYRFMQAIAHGAKPYKGKGPSQAQAKEYISGQSPKGLPESKKSLLKDTSEVAMQVGERPLKKDSPKKLPSSNPPDFPLVGEDKRIAQRQDKVKPVKGKSPKSVRGTLVRSEQEIIEELLKAYE